MTRPYTGWLMVPLAALAMVGTMPGRTNFLGAISKPVVAEPVENDNVIDLMEALKKSLKHKGKAAPARAHPAARKRKKAAR